MKKNKKIEIEREKIEMSSEVILELWDDVYFIGSSTEVDGEVFTSIDKINASEYSDGESWDYIVERKSDGKFFKFHIWESKNGYVVDDEYLEEVFKTMKITYE